MTLDPNLQGSQFLQGWALEDRFVLQSGPGVGYEFLWANAYLPGVGYQNMDTWVYWEKLGHLWARTDWSADACWINILPSGVEDANCPHGWQQNAMEFGQMTLISMTERCVVLPEPDRNRILLIRGPANATLSYAHEKRLEIPTDAAGLWHVGENMQGKVCIVSGAH